MEATPAGGRAVVVWGTQLSLAHNSALARAPEAPVVLIESLRVCRRYPYHRQKLRFVLTAMRGACAWSTSTDGSARAWAS
ncbi:MAG TPA: cryptochrome/photolyase family protein [Miltoncostaeaceae bacterium]|nr:cryptochrome/photolyase family protein [Miltoncostaeaceae bacterium]